MLKPVNFEKSKQREKNKQKSQYMLIIVVSLLLVLNTNINLGYSLNTIEVWFVLVPYKYSGDIEEVAKILETNIEKEIEWMDVKVDIAPEYKPNHASHVHFTKKHPPPEGEWLSCQGPCNLYYHLAKNDFDPDKYIHYYRYYRFAREFPEYWDPVLIYGVFLVAGQPTEGVKSIEEGGRFDEIPASYVQPGYYGVLPEDVITSSDYVTDYYIKNSFVSPTNSSEDLDTVAALLIERQWINLLEKVGKDYRIGRSEVDICSEDCIAHGYYYTYITFTVNNTPVKDYIENGFKICPAHKQKLEKWFQGKYLDIPYSNVSPILRGDDGPLPVTSQPPRYWTLKKISSHIMMFSKYLSQIF